MSAGGERGAAGAASAAPSALRVPDAERDGEVLAHWRSLAPHARRGLATVRRKALLERVRTTSCSRCYGLAVAVLDVREVAAHDGREEDGPVPVGTPPVEAGAAAAEAPEQNDAEEIELLSESRAAWDVLSLEGDSEARLAERHVQDGALTVVDAWRKRRVARQRHYAEFGDVCGGDWVRLKAGAKVCSLHSRRMSCEALHRHWEALPAADRAGLLRMAEEDFVERLDHHLRQNICSDCRGNVTRAFKEVKDLRRLPGGCRCNEWFCAPDQGAAFSYEFTETSVSASWDKHVADPTRYEWQFAVGTLPGAADVVPFGPTAEGGKSTRVDVDGLSLTKRHYCLTVRGTGPAGKTVSLQGRATLMDEELCVHQYVRVGEGEVRLDIGESAMDTFQRAEEVLEEIEEEEAFEPEDRKRMHAETPELARETLADAAALIFTERIQNTLCERCAQDNAAGLLAGAAIELVEERVWVAARDAKCEALQAELLAEEESEAVAKSRKQAKKKAKKERAKERAAAAAAAAAAATEAGPESASKAQVSNSNVDKVEEAPSPPAAANAAAASTSTSTSSSSEDDVDSKEDDTAFAIALAPTLEPSPPVASVEAANELALLEKLAALKENDPTGGEWEQQGTRGKKNGKKKSKNKGARDRAIPAPAAHAVPKGVPASAPARDGAPAPAVFPNPKPNKTQTQWQAQGAHSLGQQQQQLQQQRQQPQRQQHRQQQPRKQQQVSSQRVQHQVPPQKVPQSASTQPRGVAGALPPHESMHRNSAPLGAPSMWMQGQNGSLLSHQTTAQPQQQPMLQPAYPRPQRAQQQHQQRQHHQHRPMQPVQQPYDAPVPPHSSVGNATATAQTAPQAPLQPASYVLTAAPVSVANGLAQPRVQQQPAAPMGSTSPSHAPWTSSPVKSSVSPKPGVFAPPNGFAAKGGNAQPAPGSASAGAFSLFGGSLSLFQGLAVSDAAPAPPNVSAVPQRLPVPAPTVLSAAAAPMMAPAPAQMAAAPAQMGSLVQHPQGSAVSSSSSYSLFGNSQ